MCVGQRCVEEKTDAEGRREGAQKELWCRKWSEVTCSALIGQTETVRQRSEAFDTSGKRLKVRWSVEFFKI